MLTSIEMTDPNVTLRMLYITVIVVALFVTCGLISALHEHGFQTIEYPFYTWNSKLAVYEFNRNRREAKMVTDKRNYSKAMHYRLPKDAVLDTLSNLTLSRVYWFYVNTVQTICSNITSLASNGKGKICVNELKKSGRHCVVYSIGDDFDFDFELNVQKTFKCETHVIYSPRAKHKTSSKSKDSGERNDKKLPASVISHHLEMTERKLQKEEKSHHQLYLLIRKAFNRAKHKIIDIVKIDLDGEEWDVLPKLINSGLLKHVKQLLIESHFGWGGVRKSEDLKIFGQLYEEGFRISSYKYIVTQDSIERLPNRTITNVNELTFMNIKLKHKGDHW